MPGTPDPSSTSERRVVALFLLSLALRPVEGEDADDLTERPPLYLQRRAVLAEWQAVTSRPEVRNALGSTRRRPLGRNVLAAILRVFTDEGHRYDRRARAIALRDWEQEVREAKAEGDPLPRRPRHALSPSAPVTRATFCAVANRDGGRDGTHLVRLLREHAFHFEAWEDLLSSWTVEPDAVADFDALVAEAEALGFTTSEPIPASWTVARRLPSRFLADDEDEDEDEDQDDEPVAPARSIPRPRTAEEVEAERQRRSEAARRAAADRAARREQDAAEARARAERENADALARAAALPTPSPEEVESARLAQQQADADLRERVRIAAEMAEHRRAQEAEALARQASADEEARAAYRGAGLSRRPLPSPADPRTVADRLRSQQERARRGRPDDDSSGGWSGVPARRWRGY